MLKKLLKLKGKVNNSKNTYESTNHTGKGKYVVKVVCFSFIKNLSKKKEEVKLTNTKIIS